MIDERALIARLEAADPETFARLLMHPSAEEERAYRAHLGDERYQRMHGLALQRGQMRSVQAPRGNVVVIHGIMGGELTAYRGGGRGDHIWARIVRLALGRIGVLRLDEGGRAEHHAGYQVRATGIMKRHYGELVLSLARQWKVEAFWFDWRKDLNLAAAELEASLNRWFGRGEPVHVVAHSMGGLVARTLIKNHPERWERMWDAAGDGRRGGRLIMLGTPNHGSFAVPQILTGLEGMVRKLALVDLQHSLAELVRIVNTFPGSYQMMPSPLAYGAGAERDAVEALYRADTYGRLPVSQTHFDAALRYHAQLHELHRQLVARERDGRRELAELRRMVYVAGYNQPTLGAVDPARVADRAAYTVVTEGDGRVPHRLGELEAVPMYYVEEDHGALSTNRPVMDALSELLETGETDRLPGHLPRTRTRISEAEARRRMEQAEAEDEMLLDLYLRQTRRSRGAAAFGTRVTTVVEPSPAAPPTPGVDAEGGVVLEGVVPALYVSPGERMAEEILTRGFLSARAAAGERAESVTAAFDPPEIELRVVCDGIQATGWLADAELPVDALAVGHYQGVAPAFAELALDRAITPHLLGVDTADDEDLVLSQLSERGTIRGDLAQPFLIPDPRPAEGDADGRRMIALAGMGLPGRFGEPELAVLVRELAWAVGRLGKRHLGSVLIGSGNQNLQVEQAVDAWLRGLKHALTGSAAEDGARLQRLTLVEHDPQRVLEIDAALARQLELYRRSGRMELRYTPLSDEEKQALRGRATEQRVSRLREAAAALERGRHPERTPGGQGSDVPPTRVTVGLEGTTYRFGAITATASVPEREIPLDPELVREANDELLATWDVVRQREQGRFLEKLLVPRDLRVALASSAPLVLLLDATTARIHWEMMAQPDAMDAAPGAGGAAGGEAFDRAFFLGTHRGLTRQLRTTLAPPPEPPPPARRVLRVLVVADPANDARLPGAEEEGMAVADLFESFNGLYAEETENRVEVVRLFGPREATRTNVLRHLTLRRYDVLHYAGHCVYDPQDPAASGWVFSNGRVVSARELDRIDRVPGFVFSNACESGITPDRAEMRSAPLAPSFAEAFFRRGVSNFVCTAWPVDDQAARGFALELYGHLLGIHYTAEEGVARGRREAFDPLPMHLAMQRARLALAGSPAGVRTWGAYQHYGDPHYRLFAVPARPGRRAASAGALVGAAPGADGPDPEPAARLEAPAAAPRGKRASKR